MEKKMENDMETLGPFKGFRVLGLGGFHQGFCSCPEANNGPTFLST